ncbi:hypothetical protein [uncultured Metabacillus sp.]|nr:hypothetical protein [uncultured Metabacillus sp.]
MELNEIIEQHISNGGIVERNIEHTYYYKLIDGEVEKIYGDYEVIRFK